MVSIPHLNINNSVVCFTFHQILDKIGGKSGFLVQVETIKPACQNFNRGGEVRYLFQGAFVPFRNIAYRICSN